jgi:hypothetical protein
LIILVGSDVEIDLLGIVYDLWVPFVPDPFEEGQ